MEDKPPIQINPLVAVAIFLQVIFMILVGVSLKNILNMEGSLPKIKIENYSEANQGTTLSGKLEGISDEDKEIVNEAIYEIAKLNNSDNVKNYGAKIRDGSVSRTYIDFYGMQFMNFIVDIEELGQSYRVIYRNVIDEPSYMNLKDVPLVLTYCPRERDLIYGDFECKDEYNGIAEAKVIDETLYSTMFSNSTVVKNDNYWNGAPLTFKINLKENDDSLKDAAVKEVADYLSSLGFSLDDYEYTVEYMPIE